MEYFEKGEIVYLINPDGEILKLKSWIDFMILILK